MFNEKKSKETIHLHSICMEVWSRWTRCIYWTKETSHLCHNSRLFWSLASTQIIVDSSPWVRCPPSSEATCRCYSQTEKVALAVWGAESFHIYLYRLERPLGETCSPWWKPELKDGFFDFYHIKLKWDTDQGLQMQRMHLRIKIVPVFSTIS